MTEEDTFNRLKRLPFLEMRRKWRDGPGTAQRFRQFCLDNHWTVEDWFNELYDEMIRDNGNVFHESREEYVKRRSALYD